MLLFCCKSTIFHYLPKFPANFHLLNLLNNGLPTIPLWTVFLEGYIFMSGILGKLLSLKHQPEKKWLCIFRAICLNILPYPFKGHLLFSSLPQKLAVGGRAIIAQWYPSGLLQRRRRFDSTWWQRPLFITNLISDPLTSQLRKWLPYVVRVD